MLYACRGGEEARKSRSQDPAGTGLNDQIAFVSREAYCFLSEFREMSEVIILVMIEVTQ